jgi:CRP-like cAMP-binding protein
MSASPGAGTSGSSRNEILAGLPKAEYERLSGDFKEVHLKRGDELHGPDEEIPFVYFPTNGVASLVAIGPDGEAVDTLMIGREGMVGLPVFLGTDQMPVRAIVQVELTAQRLPSERLRDELERGGALSKLLQRYTQMVLVEIAQLVLCNRLHNLEQRTARWLILIDDRVGSVPYDVTQEFLAEMLGAQRPSLAEVVTEFRSAGLIDYARRSLHVLDAEGLRQRCCGCASIIGVEQDRLRETAQRYAMAGG